MDNLFSSGFRLGIIGGGQLGKMLLQPAARMDIGTLVLDPDPDAPCKNLCTGFFNGDFKDYATVFEFGKMADVITIEIEHVNADALAELEAVGKKVFPSSSVLKIIQDKTVQKKFYLENNIPTAAALFFNSPAELNAASLQFPCVYKSAKEGYDGRGVRILKNESDLEGLPGIPGMIEEWAGEMKEISIIVARNERGETAVYSAAEMDFHPQANLVEVLSCPADIDYETEHKAQSLAIAVASRIGMVGVIAVEMFVKKDGEIWVNESAPRPHNSGHHTIESCFTSQYEQHLRAILELPLGSTEMYSPSVMLNILGEENANGAVKYVGMEEVLSLPGVYVHIYGKRIVKPFRKMGHVTILGTTLEEARKKAIIVKLNLKATT